MAQRYSNPYLALALKFEYKNKYPKASDSSNKLSLLKIPTNAKAHVVNLLHLSSSSNWAVE